MRRRWRSVSSIALVGATALTGCAPPGHPHANTVVASTDVWGSVARAVAGRHVAVTSILSGADADPHAYRLTPSDAAAIADAALVVYNGGGYDPWVNQALAGRPAHAAGRGAGVAPARRQRWNASPDLGCSHRFTGGGPDGIWLMVGSGGHIARMTPQSQANRSGSPVNWPPRSNRHSKRMTTPCGASDGNS